MIDENRESIIIYRRPLKDNLLGEMVEDPKSAPVPYPMKCRISKEATGPETFRTSQAGLKISESMYILVDHLNLIYINDQFEARDRNWRIGPVSQIKRHGGVIAYEAPLIEAIQVAGDT
jgi:hypothetical protein